MNEGETATFNVKVNSKASNLKYMWIEPSVVKGLDLGGIDFSGSKLEIAMKLFQALSKVSLSTTDTLALKNTAAADNGRTFACVIYNIALKDITLFVTDEAKLTVTPVVPCQHVKVIDTPAIAATCTTDGRTEGSHCSVCNEVLSVSEVIKAAGHDFSDLDGIRCKNCGEYVPFPFTDVPKTAWCRADVEYVWQHGIMKGVSATKFGPDTKMTRAMFVTVLYRMEGSPSVEGMQIPAFTDIGAKWCYDAIIWAYNAGVTLGKTATTFAPNDSITRAEIVTMVYGYLLRFSDRQRRSQLHRRGQRRCMGARRNHLGNLCWCCQRLHRWQLRPQQDRAPLRDGSNAPSLHGVCQGILISKLKAPARSSCRSFSSFICWLSYRAPQGDISLDELRSAMLFKMI